MYLSKIRVIDYKSFRDSGEIEFKQGINLIVGQNNSGKTTLLEALEIKVKDIPHRSKNTYKGKVYKSDEIDNSTIYVSLKLNESIFFDGFDIKKDKFRLPFPIKLLPKEVELNRFDPELFDLNEQKKLAETEKRRNTINEYVKNFLKEDDNGININFIYSKLNPYHPSYNVNKDFAFDFSQMGTILLSWDAKKSIFEPVYHSFSYREERAIDLGWNKIIEFKDNIYRFNAERPKLGVSNVGLGKSLNPDGSNLAEVLQNIQNDNPFVFEEFNKYVSEVLPTVKWVSSVRIENKDQAFGTWNEVRIWTVEKKTKRPDLAFPLSACGTGVGQVLAILYVVVASEEPRTIIIDEPNSFLHPGAAKKLIQILNKFPQHQYFISTHSPEVLSAAKPSTITRLKYVDGETVAESINVEQTKDLREILNEIGIRFSDVFFAENILWVEGPTEAQAFPLILEKEKDLFDVTFLPLVNTGDLLQKKQARQNAKLAFEIYNRLSGAHALTPPFVAVVIDKEETTEQELKELKKISHNKVEFIPRRMFENYLLDAQAIAEVYNSESNLDADKKVSAKKVEDWIAEKRENKEYLSAKLKTKKGINDKEWIGNVDAAKLLTDLFTHFSDKTLEYRKTTHSVKLTQWLLDNKPEHLAELRDFLINLVSDKESS